MSNLCFLILPISDAILCGLTAFVCCWWLRRQCTGRSSEPMISCITGKSCNVKNVSETAGDSSATDVPELYHSKVEGHAEQIDQELDLLITRRLDDMVIAFKEQIPMASMFLSQAREDKLKEQAHAELVKIIPDIKQLFLLHSDLDKMMMEKGPLGLLKRQLWGAWTSMLIGMAALLGLLFGVVQALLCALVW